MASRSNKKVISAGRDTHPRGKGGFDYLFKLRNRFPPKVKRTLMSVRKNKCKNKINPNIDEGFKKGRINTCPALIPQKYLLAGATVNVTHSFFKFQRNVRAIFDDPDIILSDLNADAKRIWTAITFARPVGGVNAILNQYQRKIDSGDISNLNAIVGDITLFNKKPFVKRAAKAAAQAWILEQLLPPVISKLFRRKSPKRPADYSCVMPVGLNRELSALDLEFGKVACRRLPIASAPQPCKFYTIKRGVDARGLIYLAGRAYAVGHPEDQLKLAQRINNHPYNRRFWRTDKTSRMFPQGRISFNPRFSGNIKLQAGATGSAPRGHSFATIFIPPPPNWVEKTNSYCAR